MTAYLHAIGWLCLLPLLALLFGLLRVAGEGSRAEERAEAERELNRLAEYLDRTNRGSK